MDTQKQPAQIPTAPGVKPTSEGQEPGVPKWEFDVLKYLIYGVFIVVGFTVISYVTQTFTSSQSAYQNLVTQVNEVNTKIDLLYQECHGQTQLSKPVK